MEIDLPRLVIAAPASGSGKSIIATGLMAALADSQTVQGFKVGPDYIDPMYHSAATKRASRNLDTWMTSPQQVKTIFGDAVSGADIAIIEGVMGLFDGHSSDSESGSTADTESGSTADTESGSTAEVAKLLHAPVILVVDVAKMARSAGAVALGYRDFDPDLNLVGVICNRVASNAHAHWVKTAIEGIGLPVLGCIPRREELTIPERHLGLYTAVEREAEVQTFLQHASDIVSRYINLDKLNTIARQTQTLTIETRAHDGPQETFVRIAIARDEAFCFYYQDNLDRLEAAGAEIIPFSPLHDEGLPADIDGVYLGGGYPELYAQKLSQNQNLRQSLGAAHQKEMPIFAECGGLMVLTESITNLEGEMHSMYGVIPGRLKMQSRLRMGYRQITARRDSILLKRGEQTRGHEFHYSDWVEQTDDLSHAYEINSRRGEGTRLEGFAQGNLLASYVHLHFCAHPYLAKNFVQACARWRSLDVKPI
ncbi:MAG: cobyrinate a,c-diamide synthase [Chloroflexota bacterium]|nr:cobyrinate a,c-diamide synthase [Chloroflexota bacterium]